MARKYFAGIRKVRGRGFIGEGFSQDQWLPNIAIKMGRCL